MKNLKFIKPFFVEELDENLTSGKFIIQPLERGYGITIGNALRRILLSSLPGAAIVNVKIEGVEQEFTTIPGVYEDVMTIILNLKKIVFKVDDESDDFEEQLEINLTGPKKVTAACFELPAGVTIINPKHHIATISDNINFHMTVTIKKGIGYVGAKDNKIHSENQIGVIAIDSLFTPVLDVAYQVEKKLGNKDELTIQITTNGAAVAKEALVTAAKILVEHFNVIVELSQKVANIEFIPETKEEAHNYVLDLEIEQLDLSVRLFNSLKRAGINTVAALVKLSEKEVVKLKSLGRKSFQELKDKFVEYGLEFNDYLKEALHHSTEEDK
ncbi:DNA-directed RNA polymerase subunit alpha [Candidatus Phytoplasma solani]|uniref:DNA-directed RNA polymerase subunit alpha n=1 Tax=Candidatus Phytoplasma solani TaxID=69896 RepID=A0A421NXT5_9MOLU|nr:DNA-directed RNA polymerase subunit alpha [Candidatus Phytoplasma solani]RMI88833.1 DNA-directed RNA polymerase subunit alpha [Candidatus Phytoplasma solani]CCP88101.1 DNA-directed RNA polymerase subunit alpha [Candidatus Phytoplasma solani]